MERQVDEMRPKMQEWASRCQFEGHVTVTVEIPDQIVYREPEGKLDVSSPIPLPREAAKEFYELVPAAEVPSRTGTVT